MAERRAPRSPEPNGLANHRLEPPQRLNPSRTMVNTIAQASAEHGTTMAKLPKTACPEGKSNEPLAMA